MPGRVHNRTNRRPTSRCPSGVERSTFRRAVSTPGSSARSRPAFNATESSTPFGINGCSPSRNHRRRLQNRLDSRSTSGNLPLGRSTATKESRLRLVPKCRVVLITDSHIGKFLRRWSDELITRIAGIRPLGRGRGCAEDGRAEHRDNDPGCFHGLLQVEEGVASAFASAQNGRKIAIDLDREMTRRAIRRGAEHG
jgi:hypothetical protein